MYQSLIATFSNRKLLKHYFFPSFLYKPLEHEEGTRRHLQTLHIHQNNHHYFNGDFYLKNESASDSFNISIYIQSDIFTIGVISVLCNITVGCETFVSAIIRNYPVVEKTNNFKFCWHIFFTFNTIKLIYNELFVSLL